MASEEKPGVAFKTLNTIYLFMGASMLSTAAVFIFIVKTNVASPANPDLAGILQIVVPVLAVSCYGAGKFLYNNNAKKSKEAADETIKLNYYRTSFLLSWALLEGPGLLACVAYLLTNDQVFLVLFALVFLGFLYSKPSIEKFQQDF